MKNFVVCGIILLLGLLGPQRDLESRFEPVWSLGLLMLLAFICQQVAKNLRLPALTGWIVAGLILGPSGLQIVPPVHQFASLHFIHTLAAAWIGFLVGAGLFWPRGQKRGRIPVSVGLLTLATFLLTAAAIGSLTGLPGWLAILLGALASLWGPFTAWRSQQHEDHALLLSVVGSGFSLIVLSAVLVFLHLQDFLPAQALNLVGRLWLSLLAGALGAEILWRLKVFAAEDSILLVGVCSSFALAALLLIHLQLYALPFGLAAGLVLVWHKSQTRRVQHILEWTHSMAFSIFFGLLGATIDLRILWSPVAGFYQILLLQILVLILLRGLGPTFGYSLLTPATGPQKHIGWFLLPRGALLFELVYHPRNSLVDLLSGSPARLLQQVVLGDILAHTLIFSIIANTVWRLMRPSEQPVPEEREEPDSSPAPTA